MPVKSYRKRDSGIELFRIVAMSLVLMTHLLSMVDWGALNSHLAQEPMVTGYYNYIMSLTRVCVDSFVLVSGYFGIRSSWRGISGFIFTVYFWQYLLSFVSVMFMGAEMPAINWLIFLNPFHGNWFIGAYMTLYIFSFVLDGHFERIGKSRFRNALALYLTVQLLFGWILTHMPNEIMNFKNGYSFFSVFGIYMLGRYIGRFHRQTTLPCWMCLGLYFLLELVNTAIYLGGIHVFDSALIDDVLRTSFVSSNSIFTIVASVALLLLFARKHFHSVLVNRLAASAFSVFLIHMNWSVWPWFCRISTAILNDYGHYMWLPVALGFCALVYLAGATVDTVRLGLWRIIDRRMSKHAFWS